MSVMRLGFGTRITLKGPFAHEIAHDLTLRLKQAQIGYSQTLIPVVPQGGLQNRHVNDFFASYRITTGRDQSGLRAGVESVRTQQQIRTLLETSLAHTATRIVQALQHQQSMLFKARQVFRLSPSREVLQGELLTAKLSQHAALSQQIRLAHPNPHVPLQQYLQSADVVDGYALFEPARQGQHGG